MHLCWANQPNSIQLVVAFGAKLHTKRFNFKVSFRCKCANLQMHSWCNVSALLQMSCLWLQLSFWGHAMPLQVAGWLSMWHWDTGVSLKQFPCFEGRLHILTIKETFTGKNWWHFSTNRHSGLHSCHVQAWSHSQYQWHFSGSCCYAGYITLKGSTSMGTLYLDKL